MKKQFSVVALICFGLCTASTAAAGSSFCDAVTGNLVANCGFETGDFTSWTLSGNTSDPIDPGSGLPLYYGVDGFDANSGNYGAYMSQDFFVGSAPVDLTQTLSTNPGTVYSVSFWLEQDMAPTTGYTHSFTATWGGASILSLTPTVAVPGTSGSFTQYTFSETATTASTALKFAFENDDTFWSFDDVSVVAAAAATPEPSALVMAGLGLSALLLLRRVAGQGKNANVPGDLPAV